MLLMKYIAHEAMNIKALKAIDGIVQFELRHPHVKGWGLSLFKRDWKILPPRSLLFLDRLRDQRKTC